MECTVQTKNSKRYEQTVSSKPALLIGGGIGDFLHYIAKIDDLILKKKYDPKELMIYVESTNPSQVESLFKAGLEEFQICFVPKLIHWTKTNPLLVPRREMDQKNRPAYLYVKSKGHTVIEDWFLPFVCEEYTVDCSRLEKILNPKSQKNTSILVSARDKGFLWWPSEEATQVIREFIPSQYEIIYTGTKDEKPSWIENFLVCDDVISALRISVNSRLFIGTDTGFATARELLGLPNIYCISQYWYEELMVAYNYWTSEFANTSKSKFAYNIYDLKKSIQSIGL